MKRTIVTLMTAILIAATATAAQAGGGWAWGFYGSCDTGILAQVNNYSEVPLVIEHIEMERPDGTTLDPGWDGLTLTQGQTATWRYRGTYYVAPGAPIGTLPPVGQFDEGNYTLTGTINGTDIAKTITLCEQAPPTVTTPPTTTTTEAPFKWEPEPVVPVPTPPRPVRIYTPRAA